MKQRRNPFQASAPEPYRSMDGQFRRHLGTYPAVPAHRLNRAARRNRSVQRTDIGALPSYLVACLVARLSSRNVIHVDSQGVARL